MGQYRRMIKVSEELLGMLMVVLVCGEDVCIHMHALYLSLSPLLGWKCLNPIGYL